MDSTLQSICEIIAQVEGGYVFDPKDPGGETNYGISKRSYPQLDIKNMTLNGACTIYVNDFIKPTYSDWWVSIGEPNMALFIGGFAVNSGPKPALKIIQRLCNNVLDMSLLVDGVLGDKTLNAIEQLKEPLLSEKQVRQKIIGSIIEYYTSLDRFNIYGKGWMNRVSTFLTSNV